MTALRVASFNIRNGRAFDGWNSWPFRRGATRRAIVDLDADVLGLQEVYRWQLRWLQRRIDGYEAVGRGRNDGRRGEHTPVLVRRSAARVVGHRTRWYGPDPDRPGTRIDGAPFPRIATTATIELATGRHLQVTSTHLDSRSPSRRRQSARQLVDWLDLSLPQIVAGDFNDDIDDPLFATLSQAGLRHVLPDDAGGTVHGFSGRADGRRIDHILVGPGVIATRAWVAYGAPSARLPSDHWPVVADLTIAEAP